MSNYWTGKGVDRNIMNLVWVGLYVKYNNNHYSRGREYVSHNQILCVSKLTPGAMKKIGSIVY